jgi:hypothetical protein
MRPLFMVDAQNKVVPGRRWAAAGGNNIKTLLAQCRTAPRNLMILLPPARRYFLCIHHYCCKSCKKHIFTLGSFDVTIGKKANENFETCPFFQHLLYCNLLLLAHIKLQCNKYSKP